jgi:hypothetical protein
MDDLKIRRDFMAKLRDDARERGMIDLAIFYGLEATRLSAERLAQVAKDISPSRDSSGT